MFSKAISIESSIYPNRVLQLTSQTRCMFMSHIISYTATSNGAAKRGIWGTLVNNQPTVVLFYRSSLFHCWGYHDFYPHILRIIHSFLADDNLRISWPSFNFARTALHRHGFGAGASHSSGLLLRQPLCQAALRAYKNPANLPIYDSTHRLV